MEKYYYSYDEFVQDMKQLHTLIEPFEPDTLLAIARGGLTMGHFMAVTMNTRRVYALNSIHYEGTQKLDTIEIFNIPDLYDARKVLILDDISDSGETLMEVRRRLQELYPDIQFKIATLFHKSTSLIQPDFSIREAPGWIDFFWEIDPINPQ